MISADRTWCDISDGATAADATSPVPAKQSGLDQTYSGHWYVEAGIIIAVRLFWCLFVALGDTQVLYLNYMLLYSLDNNGNKINIGEDSVVNYSMLTDQDLKNDQDINWALNSQQ